MEKYVLEFPSDEGIISFYVHADRPSNNFEPLNIPYMSASHKEGVISYNPINVNFIECDKPKLEKHFINWVNSYQKPQNEYCNCCGQEIKKPTGTLSNKKNIILQQTDPTGIVVEKYTLIGCSLDIDEKRIINSIYDYKFGLELKLNINKYFIEHDV